MAKLVEINKENSSDYLKEKGNISFKNSNYEDAKYHYLQALESVKSIREVDKRCELQSTLYCNIAACELKLIKYESCIVYCTKALELNPLLSKGIYRRALAYEYLNQFDLAFKDVNTLLHYEPANQDGIVLMRRINTFLQREKFNSSEIKNILDVINNNSDSNDSKLIIQGLKNLIGLCYDDKSHAIEFGRKKGIEIIVSIVNKELMKLNGHDVIVSSIRVISASCSHKQFIETFIDANNKHTSNSDNNQSNLVIIEGKLTLTSILSLLHYKISKLENNNNISDIYQTLVIMIMTILKHLPLESNSKLESLNDKTVKYILTSFLTALRSCSSDIYSTITQSISAFLSKNIDYFEEDKVVDSRLESVEQRKERINTLEQLEKRMKLHTSLALESGIVNQLIDDIDSDNSSVRHHASTCLGKIMNNLDQYFPEDKEKLKSLLKPYLEGYDSEYNDEIGDCKTLLVAHTELGVWSLRQPGGVKQLLLLASSGDDRCQAMAAEVMCLAAATEAAPLLAHLVKGGVLGALLNSSSHCTRAAAASTLTKLAIKAKALSEDSNEISQILNTVLSVLKEASTISSTLYADPQKNKKSENNLISFSAMDEVGKKSTNSSDSKKKDGLGLFSSSQASNHPEEENSAIVMTSVERAIEVLAAMVGKTHVKEEIVHGSYRVKASITELTKLDLDVRSTAAYGLVHILAALTVTNKELRAKALADKDISPEQYEQLQELQRIKTKDESGNPLEEKKEESDPDTLDLCKRRIQKIVSNGNTIPTLAKFLTSGSNQTKEVAARTFRQICIDESARGLMIQQGGLKACCTIASDENCQKNCRLEAAHAVAKTLVTTNPHLLSEHLKFSSMRPLLLLCKDGEASNLQQFEALLSLTNILSCGINEQDKFVAEKGVSATYYLMFSDNIMVRRAAAETICNLSSHSSVVKLLSDKEKLKLFLGFSEDWSNEADPQESLQTAKATSATLAAVASDVEVASLMVAEDCVRTIISLMESENSELVHRALIIVIELLSNGKFEIAQHLLEGSLVPVLAIVTKMNIPHLVELAKQAAQTLSDLLK